jgi:hypothetical protein
MGLVLKRCYLFVILSCIVFSTFNIIGYLIIYQVYDYHGSLNAVEHEDLFLRSVVFCIKMEGKFLLEQRLSLL